VQGRPSATLFGQVHVRISVLLAEFRWKLQVSGALRRCTDGLVLSLPRTAHVELLEAIL
jgi:hypothetical protein